MENPSRFEAQSSVWTTLPSSHPHEQCVKTNDNPFDWIVCIQARSVDDEERSQAVGGDVWTNQARERPVSNRIGEVAT